MSTLLLADHDLGALSATTARAVSAAAGLEGELHLLVAGKDVAGVAEQASALAGVTRVLVADGAAFADGATEALVTLLASLAPDYTHIVGISGAVAREVMPRLGARLDIQPVTDVTAILAADRYERPVYAGNAVEHVFSPQPRQILTLRASVFAAAPATGSTEIAAVSADVPQGLASFIAAHRTQSDAPELTTARIVVAGGVALGSRENFALIEKLAAVLGAAVGATRAAVDAGYAPNDWQVGQTGKVVAPDLYIGIGISGALQHQAGMLGAKRIVAINKDAEAPLMKLADYAYVGDLFEAVPALIAALEK